MIKPVRILSKVLRHRKLEDNYYSLTFGDYKAASKCKPGHFIHLKLPESNLYFRRAMSVASADAEKQELEIIFKAIGRGTKQLAQFKKNDPIDILGPLGNCFTKPAKKETVVIIAGGVGYPPLAYFATELVKSGFPAKQIHFFYGGRTSSEIVDRPRIKKLGVNFHPVTDDGSFGEKGLVTQSVEKFIQANDDLKSKLYACGPEPMLKACDDLGMKYKLPGQLSLEAPMPCGIGVCLGCIVKLRDDGYVRVCKDGPVFEIGEVLL